MTNFALIRSKTLSIKDFDARYTAAKLKKQFKCKKVTEIGDRKELTKAANFSDVGVYELQRLARELFHADDSLIPNSDDCIDPKKLFMFSDDADNTCFDIDILKDDVDILRFELVESQVEELYEALYTCDKKPDQLDTIERINDLINDISNMCDDASLDPDDIITDGARGALNDISESITEEIATVTKTIEELLARKW